MERDAAPESLLKIISCNCKNACGCRKAGLICPWALVLWAKLTRTCQTSICMRTALK
ncbi:hypothetical protein AVEN_168757-1, partial [Araneus ventricosus]